MSTLTVNPNFPLLEGPDTLRFTGKFQPHVGPIPWWGIAACHNGTNTSSMARCSGTWTRGLDYSLINLSTYDNSPPRLNRFQVYTLAGDILGYGPLGHVNFTFAKGDERRTYLDTAFGDRPRVNISGVGTITRAMRFHVGPTEEDTFVQLSVSHEDNRSPQGYTRIRCILGWHGVFVPTDVEFLEGSRLHFKGMFDGLAQPSGRLVVEVSKATVDHVNFLTDATSASESEIANSNGED
ncbi:hypothetical protein KEM48_002476 [Puccinia striiformis f. sp. tritici PST-130]|uniref:Uncharacterized protein n=1 Tax=Puccinia striiformis f. sp. tritici PST-78 TaxID=1165861 RepID=A0A0L0VA17_9BASI|nr:hypothetical protein KEM48_002476 [Puccinia striiformis f. sp. tritici PST-130]KNE96031.1 hypothetical protein PSTG_10608 [Puccinia striiformis f. sp. tritici PST-78]